MKREQKKIATRDKLIETALTLFAQAGYEATTVAQITEQAGVAKGTFFNYFPTKEDLLLQVYESQYNWASHELAALAECEGPLAPRIADVMVRLATRFPATPSLLRASFQAALLTPERLSGQTAISYAFVQALIPLFARGQARGEFTQRYPAEALAVLAMQMYFGVLLGWCSGPGQPPLGEWMALSFDSFFHGVAQRE